MPAETAVYAVQLPGRQELVHQDPFTDWRSAVREVSDEIAPMAGDARLAFFGHSMGAMLAFETAHELRNRGLPGPGLLTVSGAAAPDRRSRVRDVREDLDNLDYVQTLGGIPAGLLRRKSFREAYLAVLQADLALFGDYRHVPRPPLDVPLLAFGGRSDELVSDSSLRAWESFSTGPFHCQSFDGGHFFVWEALGSISTAMSAWSRQAAVPVPPREI